MEIIEFVSCNAMDEMNRLLSQRAASGRHPILFGTKETAEAIVEEYCKADPKKVGKIISQSYRYNISREMSRFYDPMDVPKSGVSHEDEEAQRWVIQENGDAALGGDKSEERNEVLFTAMNGDKPLDKFYIGMFDVREPWHLFAYLGIVESKSGYDSPLGGIEACALHRRWQEQWGAEVVSLQESVVECFVERPPLTPQDALLLAREQYFYCGDIVHQGTESVLELAKILLGSRRWFFWWD